MKGIAGVSNTGPRTDGCLLMVFFVTFILLLFTLITASPERRHKADELLPENLVQLVNPNDEVEEVRSQNNSIKSGEERSSKVWYNSYLELWFGRPAAPRRRELVQSFAEPPVPSAVASPIPSLASTFDSAPSDTEVPYAQHPASPPLQPFFPPVIDHSGLPPTADERSSAAPSSASDSHSNRQKNIRKNVVIAVVVTSAVTFAVVALLFLCYRRLCGNRSGIGRNDESPLLNLSLSDYSISSSLQSTLGNPKDKEKPGNQSVYASSNHNNISSSLNKNFYSELDIVSESKIETSSLGTHSSAVVTLSDDSAELSTSTLKPPPGRLGTFGKPPINSLPGRAPSSKTTPNKPDPSLLPSLPLVPPSTVNASSGCPCPPPGPPPPPSIPSGIKIAHHPPPPPIEGVPPPRPPPPPVGGVPPPRPPPPPVGGVPPPRPPPPPAGGVPPPRPPPAPGGGMRPPPVGLKPARPLPLGLDHPSASGSFEENAADAPKAKLKPFFWDKVLANPDHSMVWHQIKSGSFQFNEEMIETLFGYAPAEKRKNEHTKESSSQDPSTQYIQIIDPRKSQNLLILLKAMNVTTEEVCDALQEGDELPPEFLQTVLKMAPTAEEELKLRLYSGEISRLGPAERFLKMLVDIPFAFKRLESLLFMCNLQEDMSMVKESFATLEAACTELRKSRLFLKLLEAVLKTGNRMNDGTFRGGAQAFKLDTLLKLSDVKGTNGKTTLLNFVVQEMIRAEGIRAGRATEDSRGTSIVKSDDLLEDSSHDSEERYRSIGLQVVSGLGSELENVKKAAALDSDILAGTVAKLGLALIKARDFLNTDMKSIEEKNGFQQTLRSFVQNSEVDITWLKEEEKRIMTLVKNTADYFHGNSGKDEGLRLFVIVRDFLIILDKACNEVRNTFRKPNRMLRKDDYTATPFQSPPEPRQLLFPAIRDRRIDSSSSDDDNS